MSAVRKHALHNVSLAIPASAAGTANDTVAAAWTYNAYPNGQASANATTSVDATQEWVLEANFQTYTALTGAATNYAGVRLSHYNSAGSVVDQIRVDFNAAGVVTTAFVPCNLNAASGGAVTGAGTGTLTVASGVALPWKLADGDSIVLDRLSAGTGLATPAISATFVFGQRV